MEIKVEYKEKLIPEIKFILDTLLRDFLGLNWKYVHTNSDLFKLSIDGFIGIISMPSLFFENYSFKKFKESSLPQSKCKYLDSRQLTFDIDLIDELVPVIYGDKNQIINNENNNLYIPIDIFGSAFYMLTMYEEMINYSSTEDKYFSAFSSYAYKNDFLDRPIVDEYLEILRSSINYIWKDINLNKITERRVNITCDIDRLYFYSENRLRASRQLLTNQYRKQIKQDFYLQYKLFFKSIYGDYKYDPFIKNIYWIMQQNEKFGNKVTFYFLTQFENKYDGFYNLNSRSFRKLIRDIHKRNHTLGLHLNYDSYISSEKTFKQTQVFMNILKDENIYINDLVSRQHYLRWKNPITARNCESANIKIDSTIYYPEFPGFKLGTSRDFKYFDLLKREKLSLIERSLIVMEDSVFDKFYLGLDYSDIAFSIINNLKKKSLKYGGQFTMLWHNSALNNPKAREFYLALIN